MGRERTGVRGRKLRGRESEKGEKSMQAARKRCRAFRAAAAALSLLLLLPFGEGASAAVREKEEPADEGKTEAELNGCAEERWAQLMDDRLDYGEIDELVHYFNPALSAAGAASDANLRLLKTIKDQLRARRRDMQQLKDRAKADGELADYGNYLMQEKILDGAAKSMDDTVERLSRPVTSSNRPLREMERGLASAAKRMMISCNALRIQREILRESAAMYEKLEEDARQRESLGLASRRETEEAETRRMGAQAQLSSLEASERALKKNLILLCGWKESADPELGETPAAELSRIAAMDPERDLKRAVANNGRIIDFRHAGHVKSTLSWELRGNTEEQMNQELLAALRALRGEVDAAKAAFDGASAGLRAAEAKRRAADLQYELGMLSEAQYLGSVLADRTARTEALTAESELFKAMEAYDWALSGELPAE